MRLGFSGGEFLLEKGFPPTISRFIRSSRNCYNTQQYWGFLSRLQPSIFGEGFGELAMQQLQSILEPFQLRFRPGWDWKSIDRACGASRMEGVYPFLFLTVRSYRQLLIPLFMVSWTGFRGWKCILLYCAIFLPLGIIQSALITERSPVPALWSFIGTSICPAPV